MLANVTEGILFPSQICIEEISTANFDTTSTLNSTSSGLRASSKSVSDTSCTSNIMTMNAKKHHANENMEEVENARHWFCNVLTTGDDRCCATAVKDAAFVQMYLSLAEKKFVSQQGGSIDCNGDTSSDGMPSLLKLDKKILHSNYTKSELANLYENHRQALSSASRFSKQLKSTKVVQSDAKSRKKQGRTSLSELSADSSRCKDGESKQEGACLQSNDASSSNDTTEIPSPRTYEGSATDNNLCAVETIKTIVAHEIASGGPTIPASHEVAAAKKMASKAMCRRTCTKPPQSVASTPSKKAQISKQSEKILGTNHSTSDVSITNALAELHRHTRVARSANDACNNDNDYFDSLLFDSSFLTQDNGLRFLQLADSLIQHHTNRKYGFLSTPPLKRSREVIKSGSNKMTYLPAWVKGNTDCTKTSFNHRRENEEDSSKPILIPFYLLLLARIEIAIWGSYFRYNTPTKQNQLKPNGKMEGNLTTVRNAENSKGNLNNTDVILRTLQKANKLNSIGQKIGVEKRQQIMDPVFSFLKRSKPQYVMHKGEDAGIEISLVDDSPLYNVLLVPWIWIMKSHQQKSEGLEDNALYQILDKVHQDINSAYPNEVKDEPVVTPVICPEKEFEDIALSITDETTSTKSKKKKKKKKSKKKSITASGNQTTPSKPIEKTTVETIPEVDNSKKPTQPTDLSPKPTESDNGKNKNENKNSAAITLQRVDGTGATCVVVEQKNDSLTTTEENSTPNAESQWERVESKCRSSRNKKGSNDEAPPAPKNNKSKPSRTPQTRRRQNARKHVRDIIINILEDACVEAETKRKQQSKKPVLVDTKVEKNPKPSPPPPTKDLSERRKLGVSSLRDIVMANLNYSSNGPFVEKAKQQVKHVEPPSYKKTLKDENKIGNDSFRDVRKMPSQPYLSRKPSIGSSKFNTNSTDQNTAPTLPETLSGVSGATNFNNTEADVLASSNDEENESANINSDVVNVTKKESSDSPPLLTLLPGPQNVNSAASSVASSLEAIHTPSGQDQPLTEKDVGYHLLNVCERLSNDMAKFMSRRALALTTRRQERGALLTSLQETVSKIWSGRSHVEMYGSCATQLDLPSSDLDIVICGLSNPNSSKNQRKGRKPSHDFTYDHMTTDPNIGMNQHAINAGRIIRLASELERQPFAVQVKAIPTASVPVLKMLADASRIPTGNTAETANENSEWVQGSGTGDWMCPAVSQHMSQVPKSNNDVSQIYMSQQGTINQYPHPWRGADCMNGLLKVDITFEGPEHGGIGSTAYAAKVIQEHCEETGLPPESSPVAQLIMALKELLAQRRLNEPFSGGLSSYALILMVVAIMRERKAIKAEMELAERQRRAVASTSATNQRNYVQTKSTKSDSIPNQPVTSKISPSVTSAKAKYDAEPATDSSSNVQTGGKVSSWASVAKKVKPVRPRADKKATNNNNTKPPTKPDNATEKPTVSKQATTKLNYQPSNCTHDSQANSTTSNKQPSPSTSPAVTASSSFGVSQGSNDVLEVLCSGEPTAGKLLMHFLLFYGKLFDSMTMAIDVTAPDNGKGPFVPRQTGGTIDPFTGMLTVDPIVVFDPLEGAESNNVARSCFAWQSVKWVFGQCFSTLTHTMERKSRGAPADDNSEVSPLLELILSY